MPEITRRAALKTVSVFAAAGLIFSLAGCQGAPEVVPSDDHITDVAATVYIGDNFYEPASVTIAPGEAVRWEWTGKEEHDVVSNDRSFVSELQREGTYTHVFEDVGEYSYLCSVHPEMQGVVVVQ